MSKTLGWNRAGPIRPHPEGNFFDDAFVVGEFFYFSAMGK